MKMWRKLMLVIIDVFLINISFILAFNIIYSKIKFPSNYYNAYKNDAIIITLIFLITFLLFRLYDSLWNYASVDEFLLAGAANVTAGVVVGFYVRTLGVYFPANISLLATIMSSIATVGFRISFRIYRRGIFKIGFKASSSAERALIIGAGSAGTMILKEMLTSKEIKYYPVGLIDDSPYKRGKIISGVKVLGSRYDIPRIAKEERVDSILIAIPTLEVKNRAQIIEICKNTGCKLKIMPGIYELIDGRATISKIRDVALEDLLGREAIKLDNIGISEYINNKVVLVTGGGGSIGSELCRQIAPFKPKELIILDIYENNLYEVQNELKRNFPELNLKVRIATIRDKKRLENIFNQFRPQVVFHAAAHKHVPLMEDSPMEAIKNNVFGTLNLAECADKFEVQRFVMISTDKAVNPTNVMGASKRICEMIVQAMDKNSKTEFVAVRFGNVLGSNGSVIPLFKKQIAQGGPVTVTHKDITRFFMLIPEASQLVLQAGAYAKGGEIFVLDMGKPVKIYDLACDLIKLLGYEPNKDIKIEITGLRPGEKLYEELLMSEEGLQKTLHDKIFVGQPTFEDIETLKQKLNDLRLVIDTDSVEMLIYKLQELVPTYNRVGYDEVAVSKQV